MTSIANKKPVFVGGAGSALGFEIVRLLRAQNVPVLASYRTERHELIDQLKALGATTLQLDFADQNRLKETVAQCEAAIFTPILTVSSFAAPFLSDDQRAIFFSSNNVVIDPAARVYAQLLVAEENVLSISIRAAILRPTMIYGYPGDGNLARLMKLMKRSPVIPLPGQGEALQQPVYFADLAKAAVDQLLAPIGSDHGSSSSSGRILAVAGPTPVTQRVLYRAVAQAAAANPFVVSTPSQLIASILRVTEKTGLKLPVSAAQFARAGQDKTPPADCPLLLGETSLEKGLRLLAAELRDTE